MAVSQSTVNCTSQCVHTAAHVPGAAALKLTRLTSGAGRYIKNFIPQFKKK